MRLDKPDILARLEGASHAVVEASAGTGKTYTLEHLVLDRLLSGVLPEQLLVVTFTDKAAAELRARVRKRVTEVLKAVEAAAQAELAPSEPRPERPHWNIGPSEARALARAARQLDRASIGTIHAFCQGLLAEHALVAGRELKEQVLDAAAVRREVVRRFLVEALPGADLTAAQLRASLEAHGLAKLEERVAGWLDADGEVRPELPAFFAALRALHPDDVAALERRLAASRSFARKKTLTELLALLRRVLAGEAPESLVGDAVPECVRDSAGILELFGDAHARLARWLANAAEHWPTRDAWAASAARPLLERHRRRLFEELGGLDYDEMIHAVARLVTDPDVGEGVAASLRQRYREVLIDECQDTDPRQWSIFSKVFVEGGHGRVTLVGDAKQAIYGFRGADVGTYRRAVAELEAAGGRVEALTESQRSSPELVEVLNLFFDPTASPSPFEREPRLVTPVSASPRAPRLVGRDGGPYVGLASSALTVVRVPGEGFSSALVRRAYGEYVVDAIRDILANVSIAEHKKDAPGQIKVRPAKLDDIDVLTYSNGELQAVAGLLQRAGIPATLGRGGALYTSLEAQAVEVLLAAIDEPEDTALRLRAYLGPFFGLDVTRVDGADAVLFDRLLRYHALAEERDHARLFARILDDSGLRRRVAFDGRPDPRLRRFEQIFERLLRVTQRERVELRELRRRLRGLIEGRGHDVVESEDVGQSAQAVDVMTIHGAKGLEAPFVFVFGGWNAPPSVGEGRLSTFREGDVRRYELRPRSSCPPARIEAIAAEAAADDARVGYVAMTRAALSVTLCVREVPPARGQPGRFRPLEERARALVGRDHANIRVTPLTLPKRRPPPPTLVAAVRGGAPAATPTPVSALASPATGEAPRLRVVGPDERTPAPSASEGGLPEGTLDDVTWSGGGEAALEALARRALGRPVSSYSRMKALLESVRGGGHVPDDDVTLEQETPADDTGPRGAEVGILVHRILERAPLERVAEHGVLALEDPAIRAVVDEAFAETGLARDGEALMLGWVERALVTPLLPSWPPFARLPEVARELELVFPTRARGVTPAFIRAFVDAVVVHEGRTALVDWKTDALPSYTPEALRAHVEAAYPLQVRLYAIGLARWLELDGPQDHARRFGGLVYVFLRAPGGPVSLEVRPSWAALGRWSARLAEGVDGFAEDTLRVDADALGDAPGADADDAEPEAAPRGGESADEPIADAAAIEPTLEATPEAMVEPMAEPSAEPAAEPSAEPAAEARAQLALFPGLPEPSPRGRGRRR
jgi:exodeoxyribonuclease V beta subunit